MGAVFAGLVDHFLNFNQILLKKGSELVESMNAAVGTNELMNGSGNLAVKEKSKITR